MGDTLKVGTALPDVEVAELLNQISLGLMHGAIIIRTTREGHQRRRSRRARAGSVLPRGRPRCLDDDDIGRRPLRTLPCVVGDLVANFNQAVNAVMVVFAKAMLQRRYVMLHASAILGETGGIAFASPSGSGKSTMALALVEHHYQFVTNDRLFVRAVNGDGAEMVGVPKRPRVNPGTLFRIPRLAPLVTSEERSRYASLRTEELWTVEQKHDVDVDAIYGPGTFHLQGRLRAIFLLRWSPLDRGWNVRTLGAVERQAALAQLVKRVGVYDIVHSQTDEAHAVRAVAHSVSMYEVTGQADVSRLTDLVLADAR
jgi:HprK-related kinase B